MFYILGWSIFRYSLPWITIQKFPYVPGFLWNPVFTYVWLCIIFLNNLQQYSAQCWLYGKIIVNKPQVDSCFSLEIHPSALKRPCCEVHLTQQTLLCEPQLSVHKCHIPCSFLYKKLGDVLEYIYSSKNSYCTIWGQYYCATCRVQTKTGLFVRNTNLSSALMQSYVPTGSVITVEWPAANH